jgi:hypothetical protein
MVDNFFRYAHQGRTLQYDLSFIGEWTRYRERILSALAAEFSSVYFRLRPRFFHQGYLQRGGDGSCSVAQHPDKDAQREEFISVSRSSRFVLALRGYGLNSFRFFEALSLGVPPILISDDAALPWEHLIDYNRICIRIDGRKPIVAQVDRALAELGSPRYEAMCHLGRLYYDAYFSCRNFLFLLYDALLRLLP